MRKDAKAAKYQVDWIEDQTVDACQRCHDRFSFKKRRHHCRSCGRIMCHYCSKARVLFIRSSNNLKRVCITCLEIIHMMQLQNDVRSNRFMTPILPRPLSRCHNPQQELQQVLKARSIEDRQRVQLMLSCKWLQQWLNFVQIESLSCFEALDTTQSPDPPGPIGNLALLEFKNGTLTLRKDLVRSSDSPGDYRIVNQHVWLIFYKLYGGGPAIYKINHDIWQIGELNQDLVIPTRESFWLRPLEQPHPPVPSRTDIFSQDVDYSDFETPNYVRSSCRVPTTPVEGEIKPKEAVVAFSHALRQSRRRFSTSQLKVE